MSTLRLVHTADAHGTEEVYRAVESVLDQRTLLLDAGDTLDGSNTAFRWHEPNLVRMSELGYHAMTMGNRELHYLPAILERRAQERRFPLLAANLVELWGRPTTWREGVSLEVGELRVGVFGMTIVQYPVGSLYEKLFGLRFLPPDTLIEYLVEKYRRDHDLVIFLSHLGVDVDRALALQLLERSELRCDLFLGGHTHVRFHQPERIGHTLMGHVGSHGAGFGLWEYEDGGWSYRFQSLEQGTAAP